MKFILRSPQKTIAVTLPRSCVCLLWIWLFNDLPVVRSHEYCEGPKSHYQLLVAANYRFDCVYIVTNNRLKHPFRTVFG